MNLSGLKSIRFRLPALFLLAALLPSLLSALWSSQLLEQRMQAMFSEQARESVEIAHNLFEEYQQDILLKTRIISQTRAVQELILNYSELDLINQLSTLYQDLNLQLYDAVIEVYAPQGHLIAAEPRLGRRLTPQDQIQAALRGEFRQVRLFVADDLLIAATLPVYHPSRPEPIAVLGVNLRVTHKLADAISKISGSDILILRKRHPWQVLASTLDEQTARNLALRLEQEGTALQVNARQPYLLSALPQQARQGEFLLAVALSMAGMHRMIRPIQQILMVVEAGALILALIIAFGLSRNFIAKLMELVRLARRVESGELETPVQIESGDEFGVLARTLDSMREEIRSTLQDKERMIAKLTIRDAINQALITRSGNELLMQVLGVIISAIQARQGSIMLVDHESGQLLLKVVYNPHTDTQPVHVHEHISFALGEGIAGYVAQSGEAVLCNDPLQDPRFKPYHFQEMDKRLDNLLCLPLKVESQPLGVISLDNKPGGFTPEDLNQLEDIARPVAIAIKNAALYELSITDGLTGLFIRRYFQDMLEQELKRSLRFQMRTALILFDIDYFKRFNDTYGHPAGDWVLKKVAECVRQNIRDGVDLPARYGGEEFAIIMPDTDLEGAWQVAERLRQHIEASAIQYEGQTFHVTISLGCAEFPLQANSREALIEKADLALYASKHAGRNCSTRYHSGLASAGENSPPHS